jgi:hypothetical protein
VGPGAGTTIARAALAAAAAATLALALAGTAPASPNLFVGFSDDALRYYPGQAAPAAAAVGASAFRLTLRWSRGQRELTALDRMELGRTLFVAVGRFRVVLTVYGRSARDAPQDANERNDFCLYVRDALAHNPLVRDVVIWNEVNKQYFWHPQYDASGASVAPARYGALLAHCWDVLHAFRNDVNLITSTSARGGDNPSASSNVSHSPGRFIVELGAAHRASGRSLPIFDTVGHHPYGETPRERPWRRHPLSTTISQGDWDKLVQAYHDGFSGSSQPTPGRCVDGRCTRIWYMEVGYQTTVAPVVARHYSGGENVAELVPADGPGEPGDARPDERSPAPDHATQLADAVRLAYCQPYVEAYFNFLLRDQSELHAWQSGVLWADWTPKPAYAALARANSQVASGSLDCDRMKWSPPPGPTGTVANVFPPPRADVHVLRALWPKARRFNWRHRLWRFRIATAEDATYQARLVRVGRGAGALTASSSAVFRHAGKLRRAYVSFVTFKRRRLRYGRWYRMEILVTSVANTARTTRLVGPRFYVKPPLRRR